MKSLQTILALSLLVLSAPAMADEFTQSAACGAGREGGPEKAELGFVEDLEETKVYVNGKEVAREGFQTQIRGRTQIVSVFGDTPSSDVKYDINTTEKTAQKFSVPLKGTPKPQGAPLPCVIKGF
jgi:hypothetical protein